MWTCRLDIRAVQIMANRIHTRVVFETVVREHVERPTRRVGDRKARRTVSIHRNLRLMLRATLLRVEFLPRIPLRD